jgi:excisionase family DNA binding protein
MTAMTEGRPKHLSISEAAAELGVSVATLRRWVDAGKIPAIRLPSGYRRFDPAELERFRASLRTGGEAR